MNAPVPQRKRFRLSKWIWLGIFILSIPACLWLFMWYEVYELKHFRFIEDSMSQIQHSTRASLLYSEDNAGHLPLADNWMDAIKPFAPYPDNFTLKFKGQDRAPGPHYDIAFRTKFSGVRTLSRHYPERDVVNFESIFDRKNQHGDIEILAQHTEWKSVTVVGFLDGHIKVLSPQRAKIAFRGELLVDREE